MKSLILALSLVFLTACSPASQVKVQEVQEKVCEQVPKARQAAQLARMALEMLPDGSDTEKAKATAEATELTLRQLEAACSVK